MSLAVTSTRFCGSGQPLRPSGTCLNETSKLLCGPEAGVRAHTAVGGVVCVAKSCATPADGNMHGCSSRAGGRALCCAGFIQRYGDPCCVAAQGGCVLKEGDRGK